jgi:hypothetical protein
MMVMAIGAGIASAASLTMDHNTESDMAWYRAFTCNTDAACVPAKHEPTLDILQPVTGAPLIAIPLTLSGRVGYKAEDTVGNQSGLSNIIPMRGAPLNAPSGVQQLP